MHECKRLEHNGVQWGGCIISACEQMMSTVCSGVFSEQVLERGAHFVASMMGTLCGL